MPISSNAFLYFRTQLQEELQAKDLPKDTHITKSFLDVLTKSLEYELEMLDVTNKTMQRIMCVEMLDTMFSTFLGSLKNKESKSYLGSDTYSLALNSLLNSSQWKDENEPGQDNERKTKLDEEIWLDVKTRFDELMVRIWMIITNFGVL